MGKKLSQLMRDIEDSDVVQKFIGHKSAMDVGAPIFGDTRLSALAGTAIGRYQPPVAVVKPVTAVASDHDVKMVRAAELEAAENRAAVRETLAAAAAPIEFRVDSPNRKQASGKMRHRRNR